MKTLLTAFACCLPLCAFAESSVTGDLPRREGKPLEDIPGLGPKKRRELLKQFGGLQALTRAGIDDLQRVRGISRQLAEAIYERFHAG